MKTFLITCILLVCFAGVGFCEEAKQLTGPQALIAGPQTVVGKEIVAVAQSITTVSEDFMKTSIGSVAYYALMWKLLIKPVLNIALGIPIWALLNYLLWVLTMKFFGTERVETNWADGKKDVSYVPTFTFRNDGAVGAGIALASLACIVNTCGFLVVFC
jgi:hypothetical protein